MPRKLKYKLPKLNIDNGYIGERIARFRKERALTQKNLAKKIGITQTLVSDYETGRSHLSDEMIIRFAIALGKSADEILGLKNNHLSNIKLSLRLIKRIKKLEKLPENKQKKILSTLDDLIKANS